MQHQLSFIAVAPDSATRVALETWLGQTTFGQSTSCPVQLLSAPKDASEVALVICWIPRALSNLTEHIWVFLYFAATTRVLGWTATLKQSTSQLWPHQGLRFGTLIIPIKTSPQIHVLWSLPWNVLSNTGINFAYQVSAPHLVKW